MREAIWRALAGARIVDGKAVVITGAAAGIGQACARLFAYQAAQLVLADVRAEDLDRTCREVRAQGGRAVGVRADVTVEADRARIFDVAGTALGGLDILINNAGGGLPTEFLSITLDEWNRILGLNLTSAFALAQRAAPLLVQRGGGAIVNISSLAGRSVSLTAGIHYTAAKAGLLGLTRHLAGILAGQNIRVNAVCPGITNSDRLMRRLEETGAGEQVRRTVPLGRIGDVDEIAAGCLFLASDLAGYVTGATLDVNGGAFMA
jgi:3-oxoacyl-[acyl-carrier protein] reductase